MDFEKWLQNDTEEANICNQDINCCSFSKTEDYTKEAAKLAFEAGMKEGIKKGILEAKKLVIKYFYENY